MPKFRDRTCTTCGDVEYNTATHSDVCKKCYVEENKRIKRLEEHAFIENLGYRHVSHVGYNKFGKPEWQFTHTCGKEQIWTFSNLLKRLNGDPNILPCSSCGGKRRMSIAMAAFMDKYGITEAEMILFERYSKKVRHLSDKNYKKYLSEINPDNLPRSRYEYHLDHITPIVVGFKQNLPPEFIARKENLQMLTAKDNLSKGRK